MRLGQAENNIKSKFASSSVHTILLLHPPCPLVSSVFRCNSISKDLPLSVSGWVSQCERVFEDSSDTGIMYFITRSVVKRICLLIIEVKITRTVCKSYKKMKTNYFEKVRNTVGVTQRIFQQKNHVLMSYCPIYYVVRTPYILYPMHCISYTVYHCISYVFYAS